MADKRRYVVEFRENYAILCMDNLENRFNLCTLKELSSALDEIESNSNVKFSVTIGKGKFFSNGLDLNEIAQYSHKDMTKFLNGFYTLLLRLLTFPVPTIAAINGHAFAGGALFVLSHDYSVMRTKKGWFCFPEINLELQFSPILVEIIKAKIVNPRVRIDAVVLGKRYTAEEAIEAKLVDQICDESVLLETAIHIGRSVVGSNNWTRKVMSELKRNLHSDIFKVKKEMDDGEWDKTSLKKQVSKL